jgi:hypothetical protein
VKLKLTKEEMQIWNSADCSGMHCSACPFQMSNGSDNNCLVGLVKLCFPGLVAELECTECQCGGK